MIQGKTRGSNDLAIKYNKNTRNKCTNMKIAALTLVKSCDGACVRWRGGWREKVVLFGR